MRHLIAIALGIGLLAGSGRVAGAQSLYGPGGLFLHPTASMQEKGQLTPAVLVLYQEHDQHAGGRLNPHPGHTWISGSLDYGVTEDLEVGVTALAITNWSDDSDPSYGGFAKYRLVGETASRPAIATGFTWLGFGDADSRIGFVAARKQVVGYGDEEVRHPVVLHVGGLFIDTKDGRDREEILPYAGIEVGLVKRLTFIAEARPRGEAEFGTPVALTLAYQYGRTGRLAVTWANDGHGDGPRFGVGAGIGIGSR